MLVPTDSVMAPVWLGANVAIAVAAVKLARRLFPDDPPLARALHAFVVALGWVVGTALALGAVGLLHGWALLLVGGVPPLVFAAGPWAKSPRRSDAGYPADLLLAAVAFPFVIGYVVSHSLAQYPDDWDTLMYHLPLVDHWLRAGGLVARDCRQWSIPGNNELVGVWMVAPFSGDFFAGLMNLPAALVLVLAADALAQEVGVPRPLALAVALAAALTPMVRHQITDAENDIPVAALFAAALAYGLRHARTGRTADLALGAVCLGLLSGVKFFAPGYAAGATVLVTAAAAVVRGRRAGAKVLVGCAIGFAVWGAYWYGRNLVLTGYPFYPLGATDRNDILAQQYPAPLRLTTFLGSGRVEVIPLALRAALRAASPLHLVALCAFPLAWAWAVGTGLRSLRRGNRAAGAARLVLAAAALGAGLILVVTPYAIEDRPDTLNHLKWAYTPVRYGYSFLTLSLVALALFAADVAHWAAGRSRFGRYVRHGPAVAAAAWCVYQTAALFVGPSKPAGDWVTLAVAVNLLVLGIAATVVYGAWPEYRGRLTVAVAVVAAVGSGVAVGLFADHWHHRYPYHFDELYYGRMFSDGYPANVRPGDRVCVLVPKVYPFLGSHRDMAICQPATTRSYPELLEYLDQNEVVFVVAEEIPPESPVGPHRFAGVCEWLIEHPETFTPVAQSHPLFLFRYHPGGTAGPPRPEVSRDPGPSPPRQRDREREDVQAQSGHSGRSR